MATNYPGAIDSLTNPSAGDALTSPSHSAQHANANDAIEAVQTELGTDPAGAYSTVKARFEAIEANDWVTSARIAADAVGTSEIAANAVGSSELADNAVDTAAIADGAVTAAKILIGAATFGSGTGTPEGVITAAPGSTWLQTDSTTDVKGWIRWIKATGTGNTGWVAGPEADTGWRNIAALLINSWTANMIQMRRVGSRVEVKSGLLKGGATISTQMLVIPTGFDFSSGAVNGTVFREDGVSGTPGWLLAAHGTLNAYGGMLDGSSWTVNHGVSMETSWLTDEGWPSSLPGSAV